MKAKFKVKMKINSIERVTLKEAMQDSKFQQELALAEVMGYFPDFSGLNEFYKEEEDESKSSNQ